MVNVHRFVVVGTDLASEYNTGDGEWAGRIKQITNKVDYISEQQRDLQKWLRENQKKFDKDMGEMNHRFDRLETMMQDFFYEQI